MTALTAIELAERIAAGAITARAAAEACLARIAERDAVVRAFVHLDPEYVLATADRLDAHRKSGRALGPLHGVPVALKDVIDTADMPTENGTPLDAGRRPRTDATITARLRSAGALILGKTVTTAMAYREPGPTTNPHNTAHTPGGSSQGSAAAVADGMVPLAVGTQTGGSVIRPAAFCGVVGFKPTHGAISLAGVLSTSTPLDTAGVFATNLTDAARLAEVLMGYDPADERTAMAAPPRLEAGAIAETPVEPTLAIVRGPAWPTASEETVGLFAEIADMLGERADEVELPDIYANGPAAHQRLMTVGFARHLKHYRERSEEGVDAWVRAAIDDGEAVSAVDYLAALDWQVALRAGLDRLLNRYDAIVTPAAAGTAPEGLSMTGDAAFQLLWTFVGAPTVTLPVGQGENGLPLGVQVVGRPGEDARLLRTAAWLQGKLSE